MHTADSEIEMVSIVVKWPWPTRLMVHACAREKANFDFIELVYWKYEENNK